MKKIIILLIILFSGSYLFGCKKKETVKKETLPEPMSIEELSLLTAKATKPANITAEIKPPIAIPSEETKPPTLVLPTLSKPTAKEIQIALKNAGFYTGAIDGKIGPKTKKAIQDFQKANNLVVDGIVGPKTWAVLSKYLNYSPDISTSGTTQKR